MLTFMEKKKKTILSDENFKISHQLDNSSTDAEIKSLASRFRLKTNSLLVGKPRANRSTDTSTSEVKKSNSFIKGLFHRQSGDIKAGGKHLKATEPESHETKAQSLGLPQVNVKSLERKSTEAAESVVFRKSGSISRRKVSSIGLSKMNLSIHMTSSKNLEGVMGDISKELSFDYTNKIPDPISTISPGSNRCSMESNLTVEDSERVSSASNSADELPKAKPSKSPKEIEAEKLHKAREYYNIEESQASLLKTLTNTVYEKLKKENEAHNFALCDRESFAKIFYILDQLTPRFADLVHGEVADEIKKRVDNEWAEKPYFGDILVAKQPFYKIYKSVLHNFPIGQVTLSRMLQKKSFSNCLKKYLVFMGAHFLAWLFIY